MSPIKRVLYIIALTMMWSPSFLFIKLSIEELPPLTIVAVRVTLAAAGLSALLFFKKRKLPKDPIFWLHSFIMAAFASVVPFCLFCYAEKTIDSALAAVLNGCSPMFTALLAHLFLSSDKMEFQKGAGISISAAGLFLLFSPEISKGFSGTTLGILAGVGAALCYAISHVYAKKTMTGYEPLVVPCAQLICSSVALLPAAFLFEAPLSLPFPSARALAGVLGLAFMGTFCAFIIYYKLIEHCGPTAISMCACFFPAGGMILGFLFLGETMTLGGLAASGLILLGIMVVNEVIKLKPVFARS